MTTGAGTLAGQATPVFSHSYPAGGGAIGRIVLDDPANLYIKVAAVTALTNPAVVIDFRVRAASRDLGTVSTSTSLAGETIDPATPARFYLFRAQAGASVTITVTPTSSVNTQFRRLRADETALGALINNTMGPDVETFTQASGWTAFVVSAAGSLSAARTYDLSIVVQ